jgi:hypothetical protein
MHRRERPSRHRHPKQHPLEEVRQHPLEEVRQHPLLAPPLVRQHPLLAPPLVRHLRSDQPYIKSPMIKIYINIYKFNFKS